MKKILFFSLVILTVSSIHAQNGSVLLYDNIGFNASKTTYPAGTPPQPNTKTTGFNFSPGIGYQFNNNWTAGVNLGYATQKVTGNGTSTSTNAYSAGPFLRYSYPLSSVFSVYGQFDAEYQHQTNFSYNAFDAQIFPAVSANLRNGFALNFSFGGIGFSASKSKDGNGDYYKTSDFSMSFGSGATFGISKNFGGKKKS